MTDINTTDSNDNDVRTVALDIVDEDMNVFEIALKAMNKYGLVNAEVDSKRINGWPIVKFTGTDEDILALENDYHDGLDITE